MPALNTPNIMAYQFDSATLLALLKGQNDAWLFNEAKRATQASFQGQVYLRGIVEFSNHCRNHCHYCGLRSANREVTRYRLSVEEILTAVDSIAALGLGSVVLQSGDDFHYRADTISQLIGEIKRRHDIAITLSLGDRKLTELKQWRDAGADRYLLKMETFDRTLFARCRPKANFEERIERLEYLQSLGYQTGSGIITHLPGMSDEILARDIQTLSAMQLDMLACGPFIAHGQTPFAHHPNGSVSISHRVSAILRLMNPGANIPATSALDALSQGARMLALDRGCNVIMPSFTPRIVCANYSIYPGKNTAQSDQQQRLTQLCQQLYDHGLTPAFTRGDAIRNHHVP
ncbi:MAG: [FeFe] hydrogenase H-cluster radical SAM maturase HydE, partial [Shewanella sp.]